MLVSEFMKKKELLNFMNYLDLKLNTKESLKKRHPIIMRHPSGVVINVLGPADQPETRNILQDEKQKYAGFTHIALRVESLKQTEEFMKEHNVEITVLLIWNSKRIFRKRPRW